jgi:arylsulfatase A-like enzyme
MESDEAATMKRGMSFPAVLAGGAWLMALAVAASALSAYSCLKGKPEKKQIILVSIDTLRGDHLDAYGYSRKTAPNLAALIKDSAYYREANLNGCWTMPSHVSLLTGTLPSRHGVNMDWQSQHDGIFAKPSRSIQFLAEVLRSRGLHTLKFAALPNELGFGRGYDLNAISDPFTKNLKFKAVMDQIERCRDKDFFLFIHTWMVHAPYSSTHFLRKEAACPQTRSRLDNFRRLYKGPKSSTAAFASLLRENRLFNRNDCMSLYDGGIHYVDRYIGRLIHHVKRIGIYKDLMIIITSDHGEHFSEHFANMFYDFHGRDFQEEFIRVPLIIKYPNGRMAGSRDDRVSHIDVVPTILDHYGWDIPDYVQGRSLLRKRPGKGAIYHVGEAISVSGIEKKMIRTGSLKYIITMDSPSGKARSNWGRICQRRLFDLKNDPDETRNLFRLPRFRNLCKDLERSLREIIRDSEGDRFATEPTRITPETLRQMEALGYL